MFTQEEIELMQRIGLDFNFEHLSDEEWCALEETIGDYLTLHCLDKNYEPNEEGLMCEAILAKLP